MSEFSNSMEERAEEDTCALLAFFSGVCAPDPERGITGDFAIFSREGQFAAIAFPSVNFAENPGRVRDPTETVLELADFVLPWAVGAYTAHGRKVGFAWRYAGECLLTDSPDLHIELGLPAGREAIPLYYPAFSLLAPFETDECHAVMLDVSTERFRACGYAKRLRSYSPILWVRNPGEVERPNAFDLSDRLSLAVRQGFEGMIGFQEDGSVEIHAGKQGNGAVERLTL